MAYDVKFFINLISKSSGEISFVYDGKNLVKKFIPEQWVDLPVADIKIQIHDFPAINSHQNSVKTNSFYFIINNKDRLSSQFISALNVAVVNDAEKSIQEYKKENHITKDDNLTELNASWLGTMENTILELELQEKMLEQIEV